MQESKCALEKFFDFMGAKYSPQKVRLLTYDPYYGDRWHVADIGFKKSDTLSIVVMWGSGVSLPSEYSVENSKFECFGNCLQISSVDIWGNKICINISKL